MTNVAIITGAASGIGREIVRQLDKKNVDQIWIIDRNKAGLDLLKQELKIETKAIVMDLAEQQDIEDYVRFLKEVTPNVTFLANCAGYGKFAKIGSMPIEQELGMIRVNCEALTAITTQTLPFIKNGGKIINIASSAAHFPIPNFGVYSATKSYVLYFGRILNAELKKRNITVTTLCPGPVDTGFFKVAESHGSFNIMHSIPKTKPEDEARRALKCSRKGRSIATLGFSSKAARIVGSLIPHSLILTIFSKLK